jgi:acid phosphatase
MVATVAFGEPLPRPDHILIVIEENRSYREIMDEENRDSYIHALARRGALYTNSFGVTHPSQPNYLAIFSGSTQGIGNNACPLSFHSDNLATALIDAGLSFASYAESLPSLGDKSCESGAYRRKHNPISSWQGTRLPESLNRPFTEFPTNFADLPTVAFVIPDQDHDMHDGSFKNADDWLKLHIAPYVDWAMKNNSLLILTWDEDNYRANNHVATILVGPMVATGKSDQHIDHYSVLRTLLDFYGLPSLGNSTSAAPLRGVWQ